MKQITPEHEFIFSEKFIQKAFEKVCHKRREYSCNNDIWELRFNWNDQKFKILEELNAGTYKFDTVKEILIDGQMYEIGPNCNPALQPMPNVVKITSYATKPTLEKQENNGF